MKQFVIILVSVFAFAASPKVGYSLPDLDQSDLIMLLVVDQVNESVSIADPMVISFPINHEYSFIFKHLEEVPPFVKVGGFMEKPGEIVINGSTLTHKAKKFRYKHRSRHGYIPKANAPPCIRIIS